MALSVEESLKEKLRETQKQLMDLQAKRKAEQEATINLYFSLLKCVSMFDSERLSKDYAEKIINSMDSDIYAVEKVKLENQLKKEVLDLSKSVDFATDSIEKSINALDDKVEMFRNIKESLVKYNENAKASGITSKQSKMLKFLELHNVAYNNMVSNNGSLNGEIYDSEEMNNIGSTVQQLISEMDFPSSISDELTLLRYKLLSDVKASELPRISVKVLELVIESYKIERDEARTFLTTLNNSLSLFNNNFNNSVALARDLHAQESESNATIDLAIDRISDTISKVDTLQQLKDNIVAQVAHIKTAMENHHSVEEKQSNYVRAIGKIQDRLKLMVAETDEFKQKLLQQKNRMIIDSLTKLSNKNAFETRMEHEYKRWQRYKEALSVVLVDVDNFRNINEKYGHPAGDRALKVIARALQSKIRETDFIARYIGEKFAVIFLGTDRKSLESPLRKLNEVIKTIPFHFKDNKVTITVSIGAAVFGPNDNPVTIVEKAETSLREAKKNGKDCYVISE